MSVPQGSASAQEQNPDGRASVAQTVRRAFRDQLPPRYETDFWDARFNERLSSLLAPGQRILDVGAGARPTIAEPDRPAGCHYTGLDISRSEMEKAPIGSYDAVVVGDITRPMPELSAQFDLVLSWLVLEHVRPLDVAFDNLRSYLRPGGVFLAQLSGAFSLHALLNRLLPSALSRRILKRIQNREPDTVFRAHYDRGWYTALDRCFDRGWQRAEITPLFTGAGYLDFSPALRAIYISYEEIAYRANLRNLAAYYLVEAAHE
jgi:SAM-dependent methyltransferase